MYIYHSSQILLHVHWYMDTLIYYTLSLLHRYSTPLFHELISQLHGHCSSIDKYHWYTDTLVHWTLLFHLFVLQITLRCYTCTSGTCITIAQVLYTIITCTCRMDSLVYMLWLFMYSCCNGLLFLLHDYACIPVTWLYPVILIWYSCYWTYELLMCDVWN